MQAFLDAYPTVVLYIGVFDGLFVLALGAVAAVLYLFNIKADAFYDRVVPACLILIGTSVAAGIIIAITRWIVRSIAPVAAAVLVFVLMVSPADAAIIDVGQAFGTALQPYVDALVNAAIAALVGWVLYIVKDKFNVDIEARHREALTAFLQRQASSLVADGAVKLQGIKVEVKSEALALAADQALKAIPQALNFFGLTPARVRAMIVDMIPKEPAVAQAQAVAIDVQNPATPSTPPAS